MNLLIALDRTRTMKLLTQIHVVCALEGMKMMYWKVLEQTGSTVEDGCMKIVWKRL